MLIQEKLNNAINAQIGEELFAHNQYIAIAMYFDDEALPVLSGFFHRQAMEEREHAMKFIQYVVDAGGKLRIPAVPEPINEFASAAEAVDAARKQEIHNTESINKLMDIAKEVKDHLGEQFLQWFINEQLEEVATMEALLKTVKRAGEGGLLMVETYLDRMGDPHAAGEGGAEA